MANYWDQGPVSKDVAKGSKFPQKEKIGDSNPNLSLGNTSDGARRAIMGLKVGNLPGFSSNVEAGFKKNKA